MNETGDRGANAEAPQLPDEPEAAALGVFSEYLERLEADRDEWLEKRLQARPEVLERVLRLIEAERDSAGFLESDLRATAVRGRSGDRLGPWALVEQLGVGGMSRVFRARRTDGVYDQDVAIKLFDGAHLDPSTAQRFDAERRILAALDHPGIARIIDGGTSKDGTPYVVMELVQGQPITRYCNRRELGLAERLTLFQKVCVALEVAHRHGVVHRDIKTGNVMVSDDGEPRLIDFGIAKVLASAGIAVDLPETRQGNALMTPEYASPEQLRGAPVDVTSDVYSLGVLLYELLTGTRPHKIAGLSPAEMEKTVCNTIPADPSEMVLRRIASPPSGLGEVGVLRRRLRGDIDRIVMTAMRVDPADRYASALGFAQDLERHLSGQPVRARGASRIYRASRFIGRHRVGFAVTVATFVLLAGALFVVDAQRERARAEAARAESARAFLVEMIQRADPFENADAPTLAGALKQAVPGLGQRFEGQPLLEAEMRYAIGYALQNLGEVQLAREQLKLALAMRQEAGTSIDIAEVHDGLGIVAWWESDFDLGEQHFERAIVLLKGQQAERARVLRVNVLANWAAMLIDAGDSEESERLALQALDAAESADTVSAETLAAIWSSVATARDGLGKQKQALAAFEHTLELQRDATGEMHPSFAIVLNNLALMYYGMDRLDDAVKTMEKSVRIRRATLGKSHPQTATALFNLARLQTLAGDLAPAEGNARTALAVARNGYEAGHPRIGKAHEAVAIVLNARGVLPEALEHAEAASAIYAEATAVDPAWITAVGELILKIRDDQATVAAD
ncbi:MAG TPA: serine/threonine-protein kinase [Wenzhouxiangellaceae bacterium]|nr:serine/threonine-protein kinase [Wenzhouxiangellaceae bacterium]